MKIFTSQLLCIQYVLGKYVTLVDYKTVDANVEKKPPLFYMEQKNVNGIVARICRMRMHGKRYGEMEAYE